MPSDLFSNSSVKDGTTDNPCSDVSPPTSAILIGWYAMVTGQRLVRLSLTGRPLGDLNDAPITTPTKPSGTEDVSASSSICDNSPSSPWRTPEILWMPHFKPIIRPRLDASAVSIPLAPDDGDSTTRFCSGTCDVGTGPEVVPSALLGVYKTLARLRYSDNIELQHTGSDLSILRLAQPSTSAIPLQISKTPDSNSFETQAQADTCTFRFSGEQFRFQPPRSSPNQPRILRSPSDSLLATKITNRAPVIQPICNLDKLSASWQLHPSICHLKASDSPVLKQRLDYSKNSASTAMPLGIIVCCPRTYNNPLNLRTRNIKQSSLTHSQDSLCTQRLEVPVLPSTHDVTSTTPASSTSSSDHDKMGCWQLRLRRSTTTTSVHPSDRAVMQRTSSSTSTNIRHIPMISTAKNYRLVPAEFDAAKVLYDLADLFMPAASVQPLGMKQRAAPQESTKTVDRPGSKVSSLLPAVRSMGDDDSSNPQCRDSRNCSKDHDKLSATNLSVLKASNSSGFKNSVQGDTCVISEQQFRHPTTRPIATTQTPYQPLMTKSNWLSPQLPNADEFSTKLQAKDRSRISCLSLQLDTKTDNQAHDIRPLQDPDMLPRTRRLVLPQNSVRSQTECVVRTAPTLKDTTVHTNDHNSLVTRWGIVFTLAMMGDDFTALVQHLGLSKVVATDCTHTTMLLYNLDTALARRECDISWHRRATRLYRDNTTTRSPCSST
jgi:hypothetical protein